MATSTIPPANTQFVMATTPRVESYPIIEHSILKGSLHRRTSFKNCALRYAEIHCSTISDCTVDNCKLFNCTIQKSSLLTSRIHECKTISSSMSHCQTTSSPLAFRRFPAEIREMIFQGCITNATNSHKRTPKILIALRCDPEIYQEALRCYYKLNSFTLEQANLSKCSELSLKVLGNIEKLKIKSSNGHPLAIDSIPDSFKHCRKIRMLTIVPRDSSELFAWTKLTLGRSTAISKLRVGVLTVSGVGARQHPRHRRLLAEISRLSRNLGCIGKLERVSTGVRQYWFWEAPERETLKWTD
ncbi:hypothetical protein BDZ45DRAFT_680434 [Acephala macrosclerotiorum]|nr:hypothetical protein BDZ45DRAFT_680434 [Acephala macrosclerotiorum]